MLVSKFLEYRREEVRPVWPCLVWGTLAGIGLAILSAIIQQVM